MFVQYLDSYMTYAMTTVAVIFAGWVALECWARTTQETSS
jgi:hypothetical protein